MDICLDQGTYLGDRVGLSHVLLVIDMGGDSDGALISWIGL